MEVAAHYTARLSNSLRRSGPNRSRQALVPRSGSYLQTMDAIGDAERKVKAR
jgi:hypothetical protein